MQATAHLLIYRRKQQKEISPPQAGRNGAYKAPPSIPEGRRITLE
jgi:hypothetical protein